MKILSITVESFRGVPDGTYSFVHPSAGGALSLVLVTGGPASGKTALLEAIVALKESVGAFGAPPNPAVLVKKSSARGRIEGTWLLSDEERDVAESNGATLTTVFELGEHALAPAHPPGVRALFERYGHESTFGKMEYFPSNRRLSFHADGAPSEEVEKRLRPAKRADKYAGVIAEMADIALADGVRAVGELDAKGLLMRRERPDSLRAQKKVIRELLPHLRLLGIEMRGGKPVVRFQRRDGLVLDAQDLSESEQQAVLLGVTFVRLGLRRSIVLIDEPELHIAAGDQVRFLRTLESIGMDNQILAATGSAELVAAVSAHQLLRLRAPAW